MPLNPLSPVSKPPNRHRSNSDHDTSPQTIFNGNWIKCICSRLRLGKPEHWKMRCRSSKRLSIRRRMLFRILLRISSMPWPIWSQPSWTVVQFSLKGWSCKRNSLSNFPVRPYRSGRRVNRLVGPPNTVSAWHSWHTSPAPQPRSR